MTADAIFVVGSSRSGTTMMGRILGRHSLVYSLHELHFFEHLWHGPLDTQLKAEDAIRFMSELFATQRHGYLGKRNPRSFTSEAHAIVDRSPQWSARDVLFQFLHYESERYDKSIPCDHTPRNLFYIDEILVSNPGARIVCMIRDPRDVLLSQKNKWRRRSLGARNIPRREALRAWLNYHPLTVTKLWRSAILTTERFSGNPNVLTVKFEDFVAEPTPGLLKICDFLGIDFDHSMLDIPRAGSSLRPDGSSERGVSRDHVRRWSRGGLNSEEIYLCEHVAAGLMERWGYDRSHIVPNWIGLGAQLIWFPAHFFLAFMANIFRMRNPLAAIRRRLL